jgi:hypothetical protein
MKLDLSAGTHYSVLRVPIWQDEWLNPVAQGMLLDFAVIWDEDHDARVMEGCPIVDLVSGTPRATNSTARIRGRQLRRPRLGLTSLLHTTLFTSYLLSRLVVA